MAVVTTHADLPVIAENFSGRSSFFPYKNDRDLSCLLGFANGDSSWRVLNMCCFLVSLKIIFLNETHCCIWKRKKVVQIYPLF